VRTALPNCVGTGGHCQTKTALCQKPYKLAVSGRQLTPLGQGGGTVLFEDVAAIEVAVLVEVVVDRGVGGGKFLQGPYISEPLHRILSSPERLM